MSLSERLRVYLVTDDGYLPFETVLELAPGLVEAGVTAIQLRDKTAGGRVLLEKARALVARFSPLGALVLVNDRVDVAIAAKADGVHLGASDLPIAVAREMMGPSAVIGASAERPQERFPEASYLAASPVYATQTKTDTSAPLGLEGVREMRPLSEAPLVGIGGLDAPRSLEAVRAGLDGVAVISAILAAPDPLAATAEIRRAVETGLQGRGA